MAAIAVVRETGWWVLPMAAFVVCYEADQWGLSMAAVCRKSPISPGGILEFIIGK